MFFIVLSRNFLLSCLETLSSYITLCRNKHESNPCCHPHFLLKWRWQESCRQMYAKYLYLNIALVKKCEKTANGLENDRLKHE